MQVTDNMIVRFLSSSWTDLVLFKVSWVMLVLYQSAAVVPAMLVIFLKLFTWQELGHSLALVFTTALVGIGMDFVMAGTGVFIFSEPFPLWLIMLWISFALTLPRGFGFTIKLHPGLQALSGFIAGGVGYFAGYLLGAVQFGIPNVAAILLISILWSLFVPALLWLDKSCYQPARVSSNA